MRKAAKSKFDMAVINLVKEKREELGLTQEDLASILDVARSYIGHVESPYDRAKYNLNQLNRLSVEMKVSPREFIPEKGFPEKVDSGRKKGRA